MIDLEMKPEIPRLEPELTMEDFFKALSESPRDWQLNSGGEIRLRDHAGTCPALWHPLLHAKFLFDAKIIYRAADCTVDHDPKVRRRLLESCGLLTV